MLTRSLPSVERATVQPLSTAPTTSSSGTNTWSKNTSLNIAAPVASRSGRTSTPSACMSMTTVVMPACFGASGLVRTVARPRWQCCAPLVHTFWPVISHPPSTRVALGADPRGVGARVGLAEQLAPHELALERRPDPPLDLVLGRVLDQREHDPTRDAVLGTLHAGPLNSSSITSCSTAGAARPHGFGQCGCDVAGVDQARELRVGIERGELGRDRARRRSRYSSASGGSSKSWSRV